MSHFVSTYSRDYTSPQISRACQLPPPQIAKSITCSCTQSRKALEELLQICGKPDDWSCTSRTEIPLKLCFTKDKDKLKKPPAVKYSDPCGKSRDERRKTPLNADRFKTTYQIDYSDPAAERMARRDEPSTVVKKDIQQLQCCLPIKLTIEPDFRPDSWCTDKSPEAKTRDFRRKKTTKHMKKPEDGEGQISAWKSEYQNSIDKLGQYIIKVKLHHPKRDVPVYPTSSSTHRKICN